MTVEFCIILKLFLTCSKPYYSYEHYCYICCLLYSLSKFIFLSNYIVFFGLLLLLF